MGGVHLQAQRLAGWGRRERVQTCLGCVARHLPRRIKATVVLILGQIIWFERLHWYMLNMYQYAFQNKSRTERQARPCCQVCPPRLAPGSHLAEDETKRCRSLADLCVYPVYPWLRWGTSYTHKHRHTNIWKKKKVLGFENQTCDSWPDKPHK